MQQKKSVQHFNPHSQMSEKVLIKLRAKKNELKLSHVINDSTKKERKHFATWLISNSTEIKKQQYY